MTAAGTSMPLAQAGGEAAAAPGMLPLPASAYQLVQDAAAAWPDAIATQWIADPVRYQSCLSWTHAELAATVTRIANALAALGVTRQDAVTICGMNTALLYAATLAAQAASGPRRCPPRSGTRSRAPGCPPGTTSRPVMKTAGWSSR
jgi:non-ribosomal peptide synthetase component F